MTTITEKDAMGATYTSNGSSGRPGLGAPERHRRELSADERKLLGLISAMRAAGDLESNLPEQLGE
jgi:hypothetical protein